MCFFAQLSKSPAQLESRFDAVFPESKDYQSGMYNGFAYPKTPIITAEDPKNICLAHWGLIPHWAKEADIRKYTLNARVETVKQKPSFRDSVKRPCLILADSFFEWQWLDEKGKKKQKYQIGLPNGEAFGFAGLYSRWSNPLTGELRTTYTILTTHANELMARIHNTKKRMPIIVAPGGELEWLSEGLSKGVHDSVSLHATPIS